MKTCKRQHTYSPELERCPECLKLKAKRSYERNKQKILAAQKVYREANLETYKATQKVWREKNKVNLKEYHQDWSEKNKEYLKEYEKKRNKERSEYNNAKAKAWYRANPEKVKERAKKWNKNHPDIGRHALAKRRASKKQATPSWLTNDHLDHIRQFYSISLAAEQVLGMKFHVDHIIPLQGTTVCGLHVPWNLRVIPAEQNLEKSNKLQDVG